MRFIIPADLNLGVGGWVEDAERGEVRERSRRTCSSRCTLSLLVGESVDGSGRFSRSSSPDCRARCPQKLVGRGRSFRPDGRMRTPSRIADTNIMSHLTPHNLLTYCEQNKSPRVSRGDRGKRSPTDPICDRKTIAGPPAT